MLALFVPFDRPASGFEVGGEGGEAPENLGRLALAVEDTVATIPAPPLTLGDRPPAGPQVAIISSGVDAGAFPLGLRDRITVAQGGGDTVGYGTYAASVLLQAIPGARITSLGVYGGTVIEPNAFVTALEWANHNAGSVDAVLLAFPPSDFLDPVSAGMAVNRWDDLLDVLGRVGLPGDQGPLFGLPLRGELFNEILAHLPEPEHTLLSQFWFAAHRWQGARAQIRAITGKGVPVLAPAGDLGPAMQTLLGIATLPEVITVGSASGDAVSPASSSGPGMDGSIKPDLVAPAGIVGLLPEGSPLASALANRGLIDSSLQPDWEAGEPATTARTRLDTSIAATALVAGAAAGMAADGVDLPRIRGALTAASVPAAGTPVWRQGAGLLRILPDATFANARPIPLWHANLGQRPASGAWTETIAFANGHPEGASPRIDSFAGVAPDATPRIRPVGSGEARTPSASASEAGVTITLGAGDGSYEGGLYCGYTDVSIPATGGSLSPELEAAGIPADLEQVPTCFIEGTRLTARGFYIHNMPAEDLTWGLAPTLPGASGLLNRPLTLLPVDPTSVALYFRVTGADGLAHFDNIAPGYYKVRLWADYGAPIAQTHRDPATGAAVTAERDIGERAAYQGFDALVLTPACGGPPAVVDACNETFLVDAFGQENVEFDRPHDAWLVGPPALGHDRLRVVFDRTKKMPGASVASRVIDLLAFEDLSFITADLMEWVHLGEAPSPARGPTSAWRFQPGAENPEDVEASLNAPVAALGAGATAGVARYPFNLVTPNYSARLSLNFRFEMANTLLLIAVEVGGKPQALAAVTPAGTVQLPPSSLTSPIVDLVKVDLEGYPVTGRTAGTVGFDFPLLPQGVDEGSIMFIYLPPFGVPAASTATVGDLSFELLTWGNPPWPGLLIDDPRRGPVQGHIFTVDPRYSERQVGDGRCRTIEAAEAAAEVCEDWSVFVHVPKDHAALYDVVTLPSEQSLVPEMHAAGARIADPERGVTDFTHVLAFDGLSLGTVEASARVENAFRTNGRFWEQLAIPASVAAAHPGPIAFYIEDEVAGRDLDLFPRTFGPMPVAPYVPFPREARLIA